MFAGLFLFAGRCTLRVPSEVLAYQGYVGWAWYVLSLSALVELTALSAFTTNMFCTFMLQKSHAVNELMIVGVPHLVAISNTH